MRIELIRRDAEKNLRCIRIGIISVNNAKCRLVSGGNKKFRV